ncbi:Thoeris anti-defense Tad2 family protein, partial [Xenorhabdus sp. IM139775]|uniref:Thoeris anti-defense Tad2 family protein n=1 Tax=Xenorhabdus sp. IM139775 TaxID=3025876 RepID=UPI00235A4429
MSEITKLDNADKKCSFGPDQFEAKVDNVAPVGSFPWALIQVYLGKPVKRSGWADSVYLLPKYDDSGAFLYIQRSEADANVLPWVPEPDDMVACDWKLLDCMLSFDLTVGAGKYDDSGRVWGYLADEEWASIGVHPFGDLANLQNKTDIKKFSLFEMHETAGTIELKVSSDNNQDGYQKMVNLFAKDLTITV